MPFSTSRFTCTAAPLWPVSSEMRHTTIHREASWAAMRWKRCRLAYPSWRRSSIRAHGDARSPQRWKGIRAWRGCGWSARRCRRKPIPRDAHRQEPASSHAVGATVTYPATPYPSTHNMGANRMSAKARDGVVNKFGQTHDIKNLFISDGSQFTSGAACNPTLTIVALAVRQADHIAGAMQRKEI